MSDVNTETTNKQSGWNSALLLAGTAIAAFYVLPVALPVIFGHLIATAVVAGGATAYVATDEGRRDKAKGFFSKIGKAYKDAFSNAFHGFRNAEKWAQEREAARSAPEATGGTAPVATKEAANDFDNAASPKVTVKAAPAPAAKPSAAPRV
jgi:hypothetical protein